MKRLVKIFFILSSGILFSSCCANVSKEKTDVISNQKISSPTAVAINQSTVTAKIEEILQSSNGNFIVKASISKVEENPAYQSLAMAGKTYHLIPNFVLGEDRKILTNEEKNKRLMLLSKGKAGEEFKAVISFENLNGWFIQEVISK